MSTPSRDTRLQRGDSILMEAEQEDHSSTPKQTIKREASLVITQEHSEIYIPKDVVFHIFTYARRSQLVVCSQVCKMWRLLTSDPYFGWCEAYVYLLKHSYYRHRYNDKHPVEYTVDFCAAAIVEPTWSPHDASRLKSVQVTLADGKCIGSFDVNYYDKDEMSSLFGLCRDHPKLWRKDVYKKTVSLIKDSLRTAEAVGDVSYEIRFDVNVKEFEKLVFDKKPVPGQDIIVQAVGRQRNTEHENSKYTEPRIPQRSLRPQKQPYGFIPSVKLYKYQLDAIAWMKSIEDDTNEKYDSCYLTPWRKAQTTVLFNFEVEPIKLVPVTDVKKYLVNFRAWGGVLGDEMGLGKTMEMIGLILANPGTPVEDGEGATKEEEDEEDKEEGKKDKKGGKNAKGKKKQEEEEEEEEEKGKGKKGKKSTKGKGVKGKEVKKGKKTTKGKKGEDDEVEGTDIDDLFTTDATLVLCPSHLVHQWTEEIQKRTNNFLSVVILTTINQVKGCKYSDIKNADVVIMSYQLMKNPQYFHLGHSGKSNIRNHEERERQTWVNAQLARVRKSVAPLNQSKPIADHFYWRRVILDEAHETLPLPFYETLFSAIQSKFRWVVSATPFPNMVTMDKTARQLSKCLNAKKKKIQSEKKLLYIDFMLANLYWRNTKASVKDEYQIPALVEDLVLLDFTDTERIAYQYSTESEQRELCCHRGNSTSGTLTQYRKQVIDRKKWEKESAQELLARKTKYLEDKQEQLSKAHLPHVVRNLNDDIEDLREDIKEANNKIKDCDDCVRLLNAVKPYDGPQFDSEPKSLASIFEAMEPQDVKMEEATTTEEKDIAEGKEKEEKEKEEKEKEEKEKEEEERGEKKVEEETDGGKQGEVEKEDKAKKEEIKEEEEEGRKEEEKEEEKEGGKEEKEDKKERAKKKNGKKEVEKAEEEEEEEEEEEAKEVLTEKQVENMTVAQLKKELKKRKQEIPPKALKVVLKDLLLSTLPLTPGERKGDKEGEKKKKKEKKEDSEGEGKQEEEKEEEEKEDKDLVFRTRSKRKPESVVQAPAKRVKKNTKPKKKETEETEETDETEEKGDQNAHLTTPSKLQHQKYVDGQVLKYLVERYGTKLANLIQYLRKLWIDDPNARVIMFSQFSTFLTSIAEVLAANDIESAFVEGNIMRRERALKSFKKSDSDIRVLLMSLQNAASGSNLIAATHIILMDPVQGTKKEALATEQQAIGRSHRQGQDKQVTIVRFIIKKTIEYDTYVQNYLNDESLVLKENETERPKLVHSNSIDAVLATTPTVRRSKSIIEFVSNLV